MFLRKIAKKGKKRTDPKLPRGQKENRPQIAQIAKANTRSNNTKYRNFNTRTRRRTKEKKREKSKNHIYKNTKLFCNGNNSICNNNINVIFQNLASKWKHYGAKLA